MEKQYNPAIKDYVIKQLAPTLGHSEELCNKVLSWAFAEAKKATKLTTSVEISGFGSLILHKTKVVKKIIKREEMVGRNIKKLENNIMNTPSRKRVEDTIEYCNSYLQFLYEKKEKLENEDSGISKADSKGDS